MNTNGEEFVFSSLGRWDRRRKNDNKKRGDLFQTTSFTKF